MKYLEGELVLVEWEGMGWRLESDLEEGRIHILPRGQYIYWVEQHRASKTILKDEK